MSIVGRKPILPPEKQARLREWAALGMNQTQVAKALGVNPNTLRNYLRGRHKQPVRA
jgi:transcriptional regulator with XRE-family HTH domain